MNKTDLQEARQYSLMEKIKPIPKEKIFIRGNEVTSQLGESEIGIFGMDINVVLERPGHRVSRRRRRSHRVAINHRVTRDECMEYFSQQFGLTIVEE